MAAIRIGIIGPVGPDTFADNIAHCLPNIGVEAVPLGPSTPRPRNKFLGFATQLAERQTAETLEWFQRPLIGRVRHSDCDVIINVEHSLMPETVSKIKRSGRRIALWYPDHVANIGRMSMIASDYDAMFIKDPLLVKRLAQVCGLPAIYMPEACNPEWHRPIGQAGQEPFIVFIGTLRPTRMRLLNRLNEVGIPLKLYGVNFPRWSNPGRLAGLFTDSFLTREAKSRVFRESRGVLNDLHPGEMNSVNARLFEATGAGAAVLCEHRDILGDLFRVNEEVLAFSTFEELVDECYLLLNDSSITRTIGDAASARAHSEHTYERRLTTILEHLL
jgi:spore maturation protein CgeB